jgi:hypothetical protein
MVVVDHDKAMHFMIGALLMSSLSIIHPAIALIISCAVGAIKELADQKLQLGTPDKFDFLWTLFGILTVAFPIVIKHL